MRQKPETNSPEIEEAVTSAIKRALRASGHRAVVIPRQTPLIGSLPGFDSLLGVEVTVEIEAKLSIDSGEDSVFIKSVNGKDKPQTFDEVVCALTRLLQKA